MIIRGPRPTSGYYVLDRRISEDKRLSWAARGMLIFLLTKPDSWTVSVAHLVNETASSLRADSGGHTKRDGVKALLGELIQAGYMQRSDKPQHNEDGSFAGYDYVVTEVPILSDGMQPSSPAQPSTDEPSTVHPTQANNQSKQVLKEAPRGADAPPVDLLGNEIVESANDLACPVDQIVAAYHELMPDNPRVKVLHDGRRKAIAARWREASKLDCKPFGYSTVEAGLNAWRAFFTVCAQSEFLTGKAQPKPGYKRFRADIDFLTSPQAFAKCLEGKYQQGAEEQQDGSWSASREGIEAKAAELGIVPKVGESYSSLRDRCEAELRRPCQDRPSRATTGGRYEHARQGSEPHRHGAPR
ncbi:Uncharacterised protein [Burkholderia pseudomallei]|uniref:hypothetical protein n=1 Tax=Burkholderia pseudomallei TaxID=28450 RepID=UPI000F08A93F|nr:hypothetical protein [Burkholderia pseudomallei]VCT41765.1 Uncharacterised protein [Burkholderia pseudomallei]VCT44901.1 Uncharacterised protein [Burkholderia pseudomallei]VCT49873.1 Uncharacterised protein [Burkholderia pseudomallei]VCT59390.1 Uncharacterised protein [Burkholderia pseudomallei]VCT71438.1 Uncharacterised protein [Burkholderia pseudomallei]